MKIQIGDFWRDVLSQDREALPGWFAPDAYVNWHCTNEHFTVEEFVRVNCDYPGDWDGTVQRQLWAGDILITVVLVYPKDRSASFHVTSFFRFEGEKIAALDEYWADDGPAPQWRQAMGIGKRIA